MFEVSGTIRMSDNLTIRNPYLTIAGQTAPSPGITLRGGAIKIENTHDVLVQHLRIRVGDDSSGPAPGNRDGIIVTAPNGGRTYNVVLDHLSVSWAVDENIQVWYDGVSDVTFRNVISSEGLYNSIHPEGVHSMGMILGSGTDRVSIVGSLFAHNDSRNFLGQGDGVAYVNNVVYNRRWKAVEMMLGSSATKYSIVGNAFIPGVDTKLSSSIQIKSDLASGAKVYHADNYCETSSCISTSSYNVSSPPIWPTGLKAKPKSEVVDNVLANVGARPADRDSVDARIVKDVRNGTGTIINSPSDVGGWPSLGVNRRTLTLPSSPNGDNDNDGYTNLEEWLHSYAAEVEGSTPTKTVPKAPQGVKISVTNES